MQFRVQGFHPPIEHFREAGIVGHLGYQEALLGQKFRRAARRQDLDLESGEPARELARPLLSDTLTSAVRMGITIHIFILSDWIFFRRVLRLIPSISAATD